MAMTEDIRKFLEELEQNEELKARVYALEGQADAAEQVIAIAQEHGYAIAMEDLDALTADDFAEETSPELDLNDLEEVAGGFPIGKRHAFIRFAEKVLGHRIGRNF